MKSKKATKRALLSSALSLVLCFSMLLGTTFAWFTDDASTAVNTIHSGTLKVDIVDENGDSLNEQTMEFVKAAGASADEAFLWEPGCTYVTEGFQIKNLGNLWLKYQLVINGIDGNSDLLDVIDFWITDNNQSLEKAVELGTYLDDLAPETASKTYYLVGHMDEDAGNDYQGLSIEGVGVTVYATQKDAEYDSFGPDYDTDAVYPEIRFFNSYSFDKESDFGVFAPAPDKASGLSITADGKAQIDAPGAWYTIDADLSANEYTVEYDIDITNVALGENVTVDTGEGVAWGSTPIMLERGSTKVYYGTSKNGEIGTLEGTKVHVTHTYSYNSKNMLEITTTVSDGVDTVTYSKAVASAAKTTLYWDIYYATDPGKATMDNFTVKGIAPVVDSGAELASALEDNKSVKLGADIDLSGTEWIPIGDKEAGVYFTGTLDGNGHTISGLSVTTGDYVALISAAKDATIKNLTVEGSVGGENAAGIVARVEGATVIENVVSNVTVSGSSKAGGIACNVTNTNPETAQFINCVNNGAVSGTGTNGLGGMIGYVNNDATVEIISCTNNGAVNGSNVATQYAGAVIGYAAGTSKGTISNFTNTGKITGKFNTDTRYLKDAAGTYLAGYCATPDNWDVLVADENGLVVQYSGEDAILYDVTAFEGEALEIPKAVTALRSGVFAQNTNIKTVTIPASVTDFGATGVSETGASGGAFKGSAVTTVVLEDGMTEIPAAAFNGAKNLTSVTIPASVTTIGVNAFRQTALTELTIPENVTTKTGAFRDMSQLTSITFEGDNIVIPNYVCRSCPNLTTVYILGANVTFGGSQTFCRSDNGNAAGITIYVANETVETSLKAAQTSAYGYEIVVGAPVSDASSLAAALVAGSDVVLTDDVTVTGTVITTNGVTEAYGNKVGVAQYGGTLDGNGKTLTETGTSAYVVVTHGGTIKNLSIVGGGRGIVIYAPTEDVIIDNVVIDGPGYAINTAEHNGQDLIVTNSTVNGWTSLAGLDSVSFTNCEFGENSTKCWQNYGYPAHYDRLIRPYGTATFTDCTFVKDFYIDLSALANGKTVTLTNCKCEGVVLTAENYANYITVELPEWATSIANCVEFK